MTNRDNLPEATRRLQPNEVPGAELSPPTGANETLRRAIIERHGETLGALLYHAEIASHQALIEKGRRGRARLAVLRQAYDLRAQEGNARLVPLQEAMDAAQAIWLSAQAAYDLARIENQSALVPLANEIGSLISELNRPAFADRVKDWGVPDWYSQDPTAARPLLEWQTHEGKQGV